MNEQPTLDIDSIVHRVRDDIAKRAAESPLTPTVPVPHLDAVPAPAALQGESGSPVTLDHLLSFRDQDFIRAAYRHILHRDPDPGAETYLVLLRSGALSKLDILVSLRFSEEGKGVGVQVAGLSRVHWIRRAAGIPVVGYLLQMGLALLRLPVLMSNFGKHESYVGSQLALVSGELAGLQKATQQSHAQAQAEVRRNFADLSGEIRGKVPRHTVVELQQHIARLEYSKANRSESAAFAAQYDALLADKADRQQTADLAGQAARFTGLVEEHRQELDGLAKQFNLLEIAKAEQRDLHAIEDRVRECERSRVEPGQVAGLSESMVVARRQINVLRQDLQDCHRRLDVFLEQARKRMPEPFTGEQIGEMIVEGQQLLDSMYLAFEEHFRNGETVREGLKVYLPYIRDAVQRTDRAPVLDVACGRGEWLDLLRQEGIPARGVDLNGAAIELCRQQDLEVTHEDAFAYLRKQRKNSISAITSFHFIEHIDYRSWIALLDEALRILKPGGIAIFETPNARNILVTGGDFFRDPTHHHPVFPETLEAIAELRGFFESTAYCFNEGRTELIPLSQYRFDDLQAYVSVSRDAAWVGIKPS